MPSAVLGSEIHGWIRQKSLSLSRLSRGTTSNRHNSKAMATHSSTLAWEIPWTEEPGRLQSMGSQTAGHDLATEQQQQQFSTLSWAETAGNKAESGKTMTSCCDCPGLNRGSSAQGGDVEDAGIWWKSPQDLTDWMWVGETGSLPGWYQGFGPGRESCPCRWIKRWGRNWVYLKIKLNIGRRVWCARLPGWKEPGEEWTSCAWISARVTGVWWIMEEAKPLTRRGSFKLVGNSSVWNTQEFPGDSGPPVVGSSVRAGVMLWIF